MNFNSYADLITYFKELTEKSKTVTDENTKEEILSQLNEIQKVQQFIKGYRVIGKTREVKELMFKEYKSILFNRRTANKAYDEAIGRIGSQEEVSVRNAIGTINSFIKER